MTEVPEGAERSEDGQYWWDGSAWQPVAGSSAEDPEGSGAAEEQEMTADELQPVGDTEPAAGSADLLTERLKPYFAPNGDDVPDDESGAEVAASLDEDEFSEPTGG